MAVTFKTLVSSKALETVQTTQFTAAATTIIDKATAVNVGGGDATLYLHLVDAGSAGSDNAVIYGRTIGAGETWNCPELVLHVLQVGARLSGYCTGSVTFRVSGREVA